MRVWNQIMSEELPNKWTEGLVFQKMTENHQILAIFQSPDVRNDSFMMTS